MQATSVNVEIGITSVYELATLKYLGTMLWVCAYQKVEAVSREDHDQ